MLSRQLPAWHAGSPAVRDLVRVFAGPPGVCGCRIALASRRDSHARNCVSAVYHQQYLAQNRYSDIVRRLRSGELMAAIWKLFGQCRMPAPGPLTADNQPLT